MQSSIRVLYVGGDENSVAALERDGIDVDAVSENAAVETGGEADCVVCAQDLGEMNCLSLVETLGCQYPDLPVILFPADGDETLASEAITAGAAEYVLRNGPDAEDRLAKRIRSVTGAPGDPATRPLGTGSIGDTDGGSDGHEKTLAELHAVTRDLMAGESRTEICDIAVQAAKDVLGLSVTSVFLYDEETERLEPVASTQETRDLFGDIPDFGPDESIVWSAFETGKLVYYPDIREADHVYNPDTEVRTELQIPLGSHGVLVTSSTERQEFADHDIDFAQLFAANVEVALERAQRVELLRERERELEQYEQIFETVQDRVCVLDETGAFLLVNDPFLAMVGYGRADLLGAHVSTVITDTDDERALLRGDRTGTVVETDVTTADGERIPVEIDSAILSRPDTELHGVVGVVRDISDRRRVRAELEQERDRLSALFENIPDAVVRTSFEGGEPLVRDVNRAFEDAFGYDAEEIAGEPLNDFVVPPDERRNAADLDERVVTDGRVKTEIRRQTEDGIRHFLFRGVPIDRSDESDEYEGYGIYTDITDRKTRERRRKVLNRVLRHNMRNEMNVISGYAELVDPDADADYIESAATAIEQTANEVADLSNKIREIERTLDRDDDDRYPVDVVALVDRVVAAHGDTAVDLSTDLPDRLTVEADDGLGRALEHVLDNAVEHTDRAVPSVRVTGRRVDDWVEIEIRDDGPGIPETEREVLTGNREITQLDHGSGLGLWLVNWIVTSLGGEVRFDDNDPRGSVVTLRLQAAD